MANALYGLGRAAFLGGTISWSSDNIKALLVSSGYTPNLTTDQFQAIVGGGNTVATSGNFASKTTTLGTADAADLTFSAVSGSQVIYLVIFKDSGSSATSPLIMLIDTATNLPVTPNGGDITVQWDNGTNKIFTLFEGLPDADRLSAIKRFKDWLKGVLGIPSELGPGGLWLPTPRLVQEPCITLG